MTKTDRRVERTRELLQKALMELITERGYDSITIQDIVDRANLGRTTFYLHYNSKDELFMSCHEAILSDFHLGLLHPLTREEQVLTEISRLAAAQIKGLGPAAANIIYFLHPTLVPPFNTAMVNGFNALFHDKKKLGSWESYLQMREVIAQTNSDFRDQLSKDLGAFGGLLFEIGSGRLLVDGNADVVFEAEKAKAEKVARARHADVLAEEQAESEHTQIQYLLIKIGRALHYDVFVARNDRHRSCDGQSFAMLTIPGLPVMDWSPEVLDTTSLIDVIWLKPGSNEIVSAFEIEKSTSIYSGILRMEDLARSIPECTCNFYLVAPNRREKEVVAQLTRPAFRNDLADIALAFIPFDNLREHCDALCKFGEDHTILRKIAQGNSMA
jgi:type II restriction enzyme